MNYLMQTVAPTAWVSLFECKENLRVDGSDEDSLIASLATSACRVVQERTGKALGAQTWTYSLWGLTGDQRLTLPLSPVSSISSITYQDADDATQSLTVSDFYLFTDNDSAAVQPKDGTSWPDTYDRPDALTITFEAGMTTIPENLKQAAQLLVGHWYENRQSTVTGTVATQLPEAVDMLIGLDRKGWIGA